MRIGQVGFELGWMDKIAAVNPEMKIVDLSSGIELIEEEDIEEEQTHAPHLGHHHHGADPHIWMSVINSGMIAENILHELVLMFPDEKDLLAANYTRFSVRLDSIDRAIREKLSGLERKDFIIYHPALAYFARDYGLVQHPLELEGKMPSPAHLIQMTDLGMEYKIRCILIQSQFDRRNAEVIAEEIGAKIIQFNPLDPQWMDQMLYIAEQFNQTLQ